VIESCQFYSVSRVPERLNTDQGIEFPDDGRQRRVEKASGGPAGMMLGYLLAQAGIEVLVLEKHADFLRDFRGNTVHPSTLKVMNELSALDEFLKRPHQKQVRQVRSRIGSDEIVLGDLSLFSMHCRFMVMMSQWEFLDFPPNKRDKIPRSASEWKPKSRD
jgi:hypothetical protein